MKDKQLQANRNADAMRLAWSSIRDQIEKAALGGGRQRIEKEHAKGKLTARERLDRLFDTGSRPIEIGALAGEGMYEQEGGCPGGGVVVQMGHVEGRLVIAVANDATVKAGAWFPITGKKTSVRKKSPWKTAFPSFTWWIARAFSCRCKTKFSRTKSISVEFFGTMLGCRPWAFHKLQPSWGPV